MASSPTWAALLAAAGSRLAATVHTTVGTGAAAAAADLETQIDCCRGKNRTAEVVVVAVGHTRHFDSSSVANHSIPVVRHSGAACHCPVAVCSIGHSVAHNSWRTRKHPRTGQSTDRQTNHCSRH